MLTRRVFKMTFICIHNFSMLFLNSCIPFRSDESTEYPPLKQMRIDSTSNFNTENSYIFQSTMQNKESLCELSDDVCIFLYGSREICCTPYRLESTLPWMNCVFTVQYNKWIVHKEVAIITLDGKATNTWEQV